MTILTWILVIVAVVLLGRELGKLVPSKAGKTDKKDDKKQNRDVLGLVSRLKDLTVGDAYSRITRIHEVAGIVKEGNEVALKELRLTCDKVLASKVLTDEGLKLVIAKRLIAEKSISDVAKVAIAVAVVLPK